MTASFACVTCQYFVIRQCHCDLTGFGESCMQCIQLGKEHICTDVPLIKEKAAPIFGAAPKKPKQQT